MDIGVERDPTPATRPVTFFALGILLHYSRANSSTYDLAGTGGSLPTTADVVDRDPEPATSALWDVQLAPRPACSVDLDRGLY